MNDNTLNNQVSEYCMVWMGLLTIYEDYAKSLGLSYSSLQVLNAIFHNRDICTQKIISQQTLLPKQTVNAIMTGFLKQGMIELSEMESDRRTKSVKFTEAGKAYSEKIIPKIKNAERKAMRDLSKEQRDALLETTKLFMEHFQKYIYEEE